MPILDPLAPTTSAPTDRRIGRRARPSYNTVFRFQGANHRMAYGLVWDISVGGIGLLLPFAPTPGAKFEGELRTEDDRSRQPISFTVAHVRRLSTGDYFVGGKFVVPLAESDIERFALPNRVEQPRPARTAADTDTQQAGRWQK